MNNESAPAVLFGRWNLAALNANSELIPFFDQVNVDQENPTQRLGRDSSAVSIGDGA
ncbi:hypothetical protein JCM18902_719 [Psychrobacter sp. JCM 18902]|nr:hypothetical protein JCM18902_719 [Psychrobacter sp. JCM 18902]